ncbi:hypothetical protein OB2597_06180 [Pseudooceanicola batsensis HTCC2597]|uniref:Uncharacterized protein n=1 Tax=Pseudooceanicola batsensis (strain ATCC BAA-863 / DSM 15984 / KCTC 12145 / HTCC2597) TaxID=252305 RepID=A3TT71_PSEBH|nr:hypothetical protein [Pseudooceanicola batsensis]EAQ04848.1 hypothetical protein OB2597_06180 [Pseudooceanicola batsensis HTCC2597]
MQAILFRPLVLPLALVAGLVMSSATPSQAGLFDCFFGGCWNWGGGGGGDDDDGGAANEDVAPTGIIHPVYMVGSSFFPDRVHAQPGDEIKFYNLAYTSQRIRADDYSWESDYLSRNDSWSLIVQADTELEFRKSGYGGTYYGEIKLQSPPSAVDFGDLVDPDGNVVGKDGSAIGLAEGLGETLAHVGGSLRDVGGGLTSALFGDGNGGELGLGTLGLGNN